MSGPFASVPFRFLFAARLVTVLGNAVAPIALAFAVLDLGGSAAELGLVVAARSVTNVLVLLFGGVIADRFPRNAVLLISSSAAAVTQGVVAVAVLGASATLPFLAIVGALNGAASAVAFPASAALLPQTLEVAQRRAGNALLRLGLNGGTILGAVAGAGVVAAVGPGWGLAIDAVGFAVAGPLFLLVRVPSPTRSEPAESVVADLRTGWREFAGRTWVWAVVLQFALVNAAFTGGIAVLGPIVADASFGRAHWGFVTGAEGLGLLVGAAVALRWRPRRALLTGVLLTAVCGLPVLLLGVAPIVPVLAAAFFVGGLAIEQFSVAWDLSLQEHVPADRLARVYSYDALGSVAAVPIGEVVVGPLASAHGTTSVLVAAAAVIVVASLVTAAVPAVRALVAHRPAPV